MRRTKRPAAGKTGDTGRVDGISAGDPGLFGPNSVTWQMHGDPMMWVAGIRALYLQALHPRAMGGVMQNSDFRKDAWGRLMRTVHFLATTTYGTTEAAEKAGARVRKIHSMLSAVDPDTGSGTASVNPDCCCGCTAPRSTPVCTYCAAPDTRSPTPTPTGTSANSW